MNNGKCSAVRYWDILFTAQLLYRAWQLARLHPSLRNAVVLWPGQTLTQPLRDELFPKGRRDAFVRAHLESRLEGKWAS